MTIDINELRRLMQDFKLAGSPMLVQTAQMSELLDRLEAAEKSDAESIAMYRKARDERDALKDKIERMEKQGPVAWQTRTRPAWNDGTWGPWRKCSKEYAEDIKKTPSLHDWLYEARALYTLPGAQPAPSFADAYQGAMEEAAIWKKRALEAEDLNRKFIAEINGPTHMGEPAQPAPSVPEGFSREDLEAVAAGLDGYEKTVNVGNVTGEGDDHLESTTAYAARFIRAMLAATPEAKS